MKFYGFSHVFLGLFGCRTRRNTAGEIRRVCRIAGVRFLYDDKIFHHFNPACFRRLLNVPGAKSSLSFPGTVTNPIYHGSIMLELSVTAFHPHLIPAVGFNYSNRFPDFHAVSPPFRTPTYRCTIARYRRRARAGLGRARGSREGTASPWGRRVRPLRASLRRLIQAASSPPPPPSVQGTPGAPWWSTGRAGLARPGFAEIRNGVEIPCAVGGPRPALQELRSAHRRWEAMGSGLTSGYSLYRCSPFDPIPVTHAPCISYPGVLGKICNFARRSRRGCSKTWAGVSFAAAGTISRSRRWIGPGVWKAGTCRQPRRVKSRRSFSGDVPEALEVVVGSGCRHRGRREGESGSPYATSSVGSRYLVIFEMYFKAARPPTVVPERAGSAKKRGGE